MSLKINATIAVSQHMNREKVYIAKYIESDSEVKLPVASCSFSTTSSIMKPFHGD